MKKINLDDLIIFKDFADNETIRRAVSLFSNYKKEDYIAVQREMASFIQNRNSRISDSFSPKNTYWQSYIVDLLAGSENVFSFSAERGLEIDGSKVMELAALEFETIQELYGLDFGSLAVDISEPHSKIVSAQDLGSGIPNRTSEKHSAVVEALLSNSIEPRGDKKTGNSMLYDYYKNGCGLMEGYSVFEWGRKPSEDDKESQGLIGIECYDRVSFDDLIGYESEKQKLMDNTELLLDGKKVANALLYGDSGTGKSSSVKALIEKYKDRGLKMISIGKDRIDKLPDVLDYTRQRGCKFIIFIDDLSFEENEVEYKQFKSMLEGSVRSEPPNTAIYVTSNRRNIIREIWFEREGSDDVHLKDTLQEKKSLSDRFGLMITYRSPNKEEYIEIVKGLAEKEGLKADKELIGEAMKWDVRRSGRSGRTARYFIDYYLGVNSR